MWNVSFGLDQLLDHGKVLCWSARWVGTKKMMFFRHDHPEFLSKLKDLLDEADAVLTYNGRRHDIPLLNREFIKAGITPPSPYKHVDLLETAKKQFKFPSNKMQHLLTELKLGSKMDHEGFPLWIKCLQNDRAAWKVMKAYNIQDVEMLEKLYYKLLPWIVSHPNMSLFSEDTVCPTCASANLQSRGSYHTQTQSYKRFVCLDCGHWSRTRYTELDKTTRKKILSGIN